MDNPIYTGGHAFPTDCGTENGMTPRDHHIITGRPPDWARRWHLFRRLDGTLADRYMAEEEREDDARMLRDARARHKAARLTARTHRQPMAVRRPATLAQVEALKARWFAFGAIATASPILLVFALIRLLGARP